MKNLSEIVYDIKTIIQPEVEGIKVFDRDVADALGISQMAFATMKKRGKIPYKEIMDFCAIRKISVNFLFFNQSPESLVEATNKALLMHFRAVNNINDLEVA